MNDISVYYEKDEANQHINFDVVIQDFANSLGQKTNLVTLNLTLNHIGQQGSRAILETIQNFRNLEWLSLNGKILASNHQDFLRAIGNNEKINGLVLEFKLDTQINEEHYLIYQQQFYNILNQELSNLQDLNYLHIILPSIKQRKLEQIAGHDQNEYIEKFDDLLKNSNYKKFRELVYKLDKLSTVNLFYDSGMGAREDLTKAIGEDIKKVIEKRRIPIYMLSGIKKIFGGKLRKDIFWDVLEETYAKDFSKIQ